MRQYFHGFGLGLNFTVQSYNGSLDWGLITCRKAMPDLPELAKYMQAAHQELLQLTPVAAAPGRAHETPPEKAAAPAPLKLVKTKAAAAHKAAPAPARKPARKLVRAKRLAKAKQAA